MPKLLPRLGHRCLILWVIVVATLYLGNILWSFQRLTTTVSVLKEQQSNPTQLSNFRADTLPNISSSAVARVLILIVSIPRTPEVICSTISSIQNHFIDPFWQPLVLVHRYGPWIPVCPRSIILREFPPHERVSNRQQTLDYLHLINDALIWTEQVDYVLFLDDDVTLCPEFPKILSLIHQVAPRFTLAHLGRGGSGVWIPYSHLPDVQSRVYEEAHSLHKQRRPKNIDKLLLEWGIDTGCTVRPTTIHMRHEGLQSRLHPGHSWEDIDRCGEPTNNKAWQSFSETQLHPQLFSEYCVHPRQCSPYTALANCQCSEGYTGNDCGIPIHSSNHYVRRTRNAPLVALLAYPRTTTTNTHPLPIDQQVLADAAVHSLINLYVIGNYSRRGWLAENVYVSTSDPQFAFDTELRNSSRFGELAFPMELILLNTLLTPQELWTLKYYEVKDQK